MKDKLNLLAKSLDRIKFQESLRYYTFTKSLVIAQSLYIATNLKELIKALEIAYELGIPTFVIGSGTKISNQKIAGLVIKNRARNIRIASIKGKVGINGIGLEEAMVEVESGVTFEELNKFLVTNNLEEFAYVDSLKATIGGSISLNPYLIDIVQQIRVWEDGEIITIDMANLNSLKQVILSVVIKIKAEKTN